MYKRTKLECYECGNELVAYSYDWPPMISICTICSSLGQLIAFDREEGSCSYVFQDEVERHVG